MKIRHLSKIIFINSADIKFQELNLDGNVHFIGDQGTGKSTMLRALLFLYSPSNEKRRLGIGRDDKTFLDYYFEWDNSHIIYEIQAEDAKFMVWLTKENNRPAFRFVDTAFQSDFFIEKTATGFRFLVPEEVKTNLRNLKVDVNRKINLLSEFKDILYGASKENRFKPFSLMQSTAYQNIPNSITNIFLSSSLKSSNIKETIIHSLIDEEQVDDKNKYFINLSGTRRDIEEFEFDYNDIADFDITKQKAKQLISLADKYTKLEQDKLITAQNLGESNLYFKDKLIETTTEFIETEKNVTVIETSLKEIKKKHSESEKVLEKQLTVLESDLEKAQKRENYWKTIKVNETLIGIEAIKNKANEKDKLHNLKNSKETELKSLTAQFENIELKYKVLFDKIENDKQASLNLIKSTFSDNKTLLTDKKNKTTEYYANKAEELNHAYEKNIENIRNQKDELQSSLNHYEKLRTKIQSQEIYKNQIADLTEQISESEKNKNNNISDIKIFKNSIDNKGKQAKSQEQLLENEFTTSKKEIEQKISATKQQINEIETDLKSFENSFYKFLNDNYSGWEDKIAKVCDKSVLFSSSLNPKLHEISDLFYGLEIDLSDVETKVKSIQEYEEDKEQLNITLKNQQNEFQKLLDKNEVDKAKFVQSRNKKIGEIKRKIEKLEADNYQIDINISRNEVKIEDFTTKEKEEKAKQLAEIEPKISSTNKQIGSINTKITQQKETIKQQKEVLKSEKGIKLKQIEEKLQSVQLKYEQGLNKIETDFNTQRKQKETEKLKELAGEGADAEAIGILENALQEIKVKLNEIKELQSKYINKYEIEYEEIIKIPEYTDDVNQKKLEFEEHKTLNQTELEKYNSDFQTAKKKFEELSELKEEIEEDLKSYEAFQKHQLYKDLEYYIQIAAIGKYHEKLSTHIDKLNSLSYEINSQGNELQKETKEFLSPFRIDNIFNFPKVLSSEGECVDFIKNNLKEYIEEEKIEIVKQQTKKKHAGLIKHIAGDIDILVSKRQNIDKIIGGMNGDFKNDNFVNAIQDFKMRTQDTANPIVQIFLEIKKHHDDNPFNLEETPNLFSELKMEDSKQQSINLLTSLLKALKENKKEQIDLEDIFELEFSVKQNNKETGWKKELSDVGSHGTDILLKAMIYIMLLNIFKENASKKSKFRDFKLHCIMDEIGRIHTKNIKGLIRFASSRGIWVVFGSPEENDALAYKYVYNFEKQNGITQATRLIYDKRK
ncbi:MAG: ATP-binding protein [Bacteroidota bacterium]